MATPIAPSGVFLALILAPSNVGADVLLRNAARHRRPRWLTLVTGLNVTRAAVRTVARVLVVR